MAGNTVYNTVCRQVGFKVCKEGRALGFKVVKEGRASLKAQAGSKVFKAGMAFGFKIFKAGRALETAATSKASVVAAVAAEAAAAEQSTNPTIYFYVEMSTHVFQHFNSKTISINALTGICHFKDEESFKGGNMEH